MPPFLLSLLTVLAQAEAPGFIETCVREPEAGATFPFREAVFKVIANCTVANVAGAILPPAVKILLIVLGAYFATRLAKKLVKTLMRRIKEQGLARLESLRSRGPLGTTGPLDLARANMRTETIGGVLRSLAVVVIWAIAVMMILGIFNVPLGPLLASAGILGVALGFGSQRLVQDFLSGIFMLLEDQYGIGDIVDAGEAVGWIEGVTLRTTRIRDIEGVVWHIPNGEIRRIANMSQQWAQALLDVGVAYATDVEHATSVMKRVADEMWQSDDWADTILEEPVIWGLQDFAENQLLIRIAIKTMPGQQFPVSREYRKRLKQAFDDEGIEIPFPQRTVWTRTHPDDAGNGKPERSPPARVTAPKQTSNPSDTGAP